MSKEGEHGKLIASAAKAALVPLGCRRIGRSRTWLADQHFWAIVIEFQPSGFSKGSYLNVGASWLWYAKESWSFDYGYRTEGFIEFENAMQFAPEAERLAALAAAEVVRFREKFRSPPNIARGLMVAINSNPWTVYHAAVAAGLVGDVAGSRQLFRRLIEQAVTHDWEAKLKAASAALTEKLFDRATFVEAVLAIVEVSRALHKLPPDPECRDALTHRGSA
ncbi:MAG: hypothetical protein ACREDZ_00315 [Kiloniellales bacterium]